MRLALAIGLWVSLSTASHAQGVNAGAHPYATDRPFDASAVATFDTPWAVAFLPDGRMLVTEKPGRIFLVTQNGRKTALGNVPAVAAEGQNGLLDIAVSPSFRADRTLYFTYSEPGGSGSSLVLARAALVATGAGASLEGPQVIWRQTPAGGGGQSGGIIAFDPEKAHLFLTVGDRMRPATAQDPDQARGKVLRLNLDGTTPADNLQAARGGVRARTWTIGHRNPYGLAFAPDGKLWLHEMGPRGGDELNRLQAGANYGWPFVSDGDEYSGTPIPRPSTHPEFVPPVLYWNPVVAPAGLVFYDGRLFPRWRGSAFIGGLASSALIRLTFDGGGGAHEADRWDMQARIRDVAVAPDGALWVIEDDSEGRLLRLAPAVD